MKFLNTCSFVMVLTAFFKNIFKGENNRRHAKKMEVKHGQT